MEKHRVALVKCPGYESSSVSAALGRQFNLLGGLDKFILPGDSVLIKPNLIAPKPAGCAAQTDPAVIFELAKMLKDFGAKPFVADSPAWSNTFNCVKALGLHDKLEYLGVPVKQLDQPVSCRIGIDRIRVGISRYAVEADKIINLPKFKMHQQIGATFAVKNMFGCVCGKKKALWHFKKGDSKDEFSTLLIDIYKYLAPAINIIDAVLAMEGAGPIRGNPKKLGFLIAGTDPISCETVCANIVNLDPHSLPIVNTAAKLNFGCTDIRQIEILGDPLPAPLTDFQHAPDMPIKFTLAHVLKSVIKQMLILTGRKKNNSPPL